MGSYMDRRMQKLIDKTISDITEGLEDEYPAVPSVSSQEKNLATRTLEKILQSFEGVDALNNFAVYIPLISAYLQNIDDETFRNILKQAIATIEDLQNEI